MKSFKELASSLQLEAKATYCGRCGTTHVPPSQGGTCPALKKEEASPMAKPPKNEFGKKEDALAHAKEHGGKVMKKTFTHPTSGMKTSSYVVVKEETEQIDEISREKLSKYVDRAQDDFTHQNTARRNTTGDAQKEYARKEKIRRKGISRAIDRLYPQSEETEIEEGHQVVAKTKDGETFKSAVYPTKKQAMDMHYKMAKGNKYAKVDTVKVQEELQQGETMSSMEQYLAAIEGKADFRSGLEEKTLTPAELKKREEIAKAMERENPGMDKSKKMAIATATAKKVAEEAEDLDEISAAAKQNYINAAALDVARHGNMLGRAQAGMKKFSPSHVSGRLIDKRLKGIATATSKLAKEETENMHYCAKHVYSDRFGEGFVVEGSHAEPDEQGLIEWYDVDFGGTVRRVMTEKVKVMHAEYHMNHKRKMKEEEGKTHTVPKTAKEKSLAALAEPKDKITHADVMVGRGVKKEEVEQIDELSTDTLRSYMGKSARDNLANLIKPGEEAKAKAAKRFSGLQKASAKVANKEMAKEEKEDLPFDAPYKKAEDEKKTDKSGAVHTPMSRARHLARQAMKKQVKENFDMDINDEEADSLIENVDFEQLAEISKATLGSYIKKAKGSAIGAAQVTGMGAGMTGPKTQEKAERKLQKRTAGINKAVDRLTSEEAELEEGMITYTDFMDKIKMHRKAGHKVVDDKYSDKKASYTTIDSEGQGRKVTHTSSGQKVENLGKVDGEDGEAAETKPIEKRGRGRPAGSKSGARTQ